MGGYVKADHGKRASELLRLLEDAPEDGDRIALGRSQRYSANDRDRWEWICLDRYKDHVRLTVFGWGSGLGCAIDRFADLIKHPDQWHPGRQPLDKETQLLKDFVPDEMPSSIELI